MLRKIKGRRRRGNKGWDVGWHLWVNEHEFKQTLGEGTGQGRLLCWSPWVTKSWVWLSNWTTTTIVAKLLDFKSWKKMTVLWSFKCQKLSRKPWFIHFFLNKHSLGYNPKFLKSSCFIFFWPVLSYFIKEWTFKDPPLWSWAPFFWISTLEIWVDQEIRRLGLIHTYHYI